jgi:very-short-patch-repair endonuclease
VVTKRTSKEREQRKPLHIHARSMRHIPTEAEKKFWWMVRAHRLGGYKFKRQYPIGRYIADFVCLEAKLIIELDGGQHAEQKAYDAARDAFFQSKGFTVWRLWNFEFSENQDPVARKLLAMLDGAVAAPSP